MRLFIFATVLIVLSHSSVGNSHGFLTNDTALISLIVTGDVLPIISVGEVVDGVLFEGIPDGIGVTAHDSENDWVDVYVAHEQTTVPFLNARDFTDSSVTKWTLDIESGAIVGADIAISSDEGFLRFCSASIATPEDGFDTPVFFANEEANSIVPRALEAPYPSDLAIAPMRQGGYVVPLDTSTGHFAPIAGMGRFNHENNVAIPGYDQLALISTDDTFSPTTSQLYLYLADDQKHLFNDKGSLWSFRVTHKNGVAVAVEDPFNDANDYLDLGIDDEMRGVFIRVPKQVAQGKTIEAPQDALENWSVQNNVFTFIRLEDVAVDKNDSRIVYVADTGASRVVPNPETGRLHRPRGTAGLADNGRIFKFVFDPYDPRLVNSFTVLADGDTDTSHPKYVGFTTPDNIDTSRNSLMVQEDTTSSQIWQHQFHDNSWRAVADILDTGGESSGIVDASNWFGPGAWLLDVQAHTLPPVDSIMDGDILIKREAGQLLLMTIPES